MKKIIFVTLLFIAGCSDSLNYIKLNLPNENPKYYEFDNSISEIKNVIAKELYYKGNSYPYHVDYYKKGEEKPSFYGQDSIIKLMIDEEYYFVKMKISSIPNSRIYFSENKKPLHYYGEYIISFVPLAERRIKVEILTYRNYILLGEKGLSKVLSLIMGGGHHWVVTKYVEPSTIEEYEILLKIGEGLGVKDKMPPLILPDTTSYEVIKYQ